MELHRKALTTGILHAFAAQIICVNVQFFSYTLKAISYYGIAVILTGNESPFSLAFLYRLIGSPVSILKLNRFSAHSKRGKLMSKAYSEHRDFTNKPCNLFYTECIFCRIPWTI